MAIKKLGEPEKILEVAKNKEEFDKMWNKISKTGNLVRCGICGHLISKQDTETGYSTIKHKDLSAIVKGTDIQITCPKCGNIIKI